jgi:LAO/AO transport system kinase
VVDGIETLVDAAMAGRPRAVGRLISLVEDAVGDESGASDPDLREVTRLLVTRMAGVPPPQVVGLTGAPGVGKSTTTAALVSSYRSRGQRVGVLAVDPSSPFSGGALLGDRVRMQDHALDDGVFIRSMASRGHLGGLSWGTPQALRVLQAAGCDVVLIETVGVGQAEVEVAGLADTTVVLVAPGMGDAIQAAKAGILEVADVFCVNKADREGAETTARDLRHMLALGDRRDPCDWTPPIVLTVAARNEGIDGLVAAIADHRAWSDSADRMSTRRRRRAAEEIQAIAMNLVRRRLGAVESGEVLESLAAEVAEGGLDPYRAADRLLGWVT